jgi:DNA-binding response OmpR family regulator
LVVDDDRNVLPALAPLLEVHSSYHVPSASGFAAAVSLLESGRVDLLVVDSVLPKPQSGKEIANVARTVRPDAAIVLTTADWKPDLDAFPDGTFTQRCREGEHE